MTAPASAWFTTFGRPRTGATRLLCMAGGGAFASEFQEWPEALGGSADVVAVVLPGRERRIREPAIHSMTELVDALATEIEPWLDEPLAMFGHSLGALVLFELASTLRDRFSPVHLFVSSERAPTVPPPWYLPSSCSDEDILNHVRELNGAPEDVLVNRAFMRSFLPGMRADIGVRESYCPDPAAPVLTCPITAFAGDHDSLAGTLEEARAWERETSGPFEMVVVPGRHLFLRTHLSIITDHTAARLAAARSEAYDYGTPTERQLAMIWADVLKLDKVRRDQDFFDLGGDSLLATKVVLETRRTWNIDFTLRALIDTPVLADLAGEIDLRANQGQEVKNAN
jgi:medium-chain acyl-[acyl-carrier-protein] hydrolase